jgi:RsiW-degrading membrane proteinase PrsW (M82 family)
MNISVIFALAFLPGVFWLWYFYKKDKFEPEPKRLIVKTFFWGMAGIIPAFIFEFPFSGMVLTVIAAPIVEESVKFTAVYKTIYSDAEFDEPMDGIVYAAAAALGFASIENVLYLLRASQSSGLIIGSFQFTSAFGAVMGTIAVRSILTVPAHVIFALLWGEALGIAKFAAPAQRMSLIWNGLVLSIGAHALFNFLLSIFPIISFAMLILVTSAWGMTHRKIEAALRASPFKPGGPGAGAGQPAERDPPPGED